ncbi:hypothetical protein [Massilia timonae]|uniref:hypothetical protein n=1 Tax=Massilia timonae TaxID=47229 RepID=UPI0023576347|nr:hypothetical protein [Massilia timonae]
MALGLSESSTQQDRIDQHFLACVQRTIGRSLTSAEEAMAIDVRDQGGYNAMEAATEILAHAKPKLAQPVDDVLVDLIRQKSAGLTAAVRARQPQATKLVIELLGDYLTNDQAIATLVHESLAGTNSLQGVITDLIWAEAEQLAERELAAIQREQRALTDDDRVARHLDAQPA